MSDDCGMDKGGFGRVSGEKFGIMQCIGWNFEKLWLDSTRTGVAESDGTFSLSRRPEKMKTI